MSLSDIKLQLQAIYDLSPTSIRAVFCTDLEGMPIEKIDPIQSFSQNEGETLCSFAAEIFEAMKGIQAGLHNFKGFNSILAQSDSFNLILFIDVEWFILGVITEQQANIGLIRSIVLDSLPTIRQTFKTILSGSE